MDEWHAKISFDFAPEPRDEDLDRARLVLVVPLPHALAELGAGKRAARLLHQDLEHLEFARRKRDRLPGPRDLVLTDIHVQVGHLEQVAGGAAGAATAEGLDARDKLVAINKWFCGELRYLIEKLATTPEPGTTGTLLDNTLVVWTNELGKGDSHTLDNIPFVLVGNGYGFKMGRSLKLNKVAHNRLHLALAHAVGHELKTFGTAKLCEGGKLDLA